MKDRFSPAAPTVFSATPFTVWQIMRNGATLGFVMVAAYALLFVIYAVVRSSLQIATILSAAEGLWGTLIANAFSILLPSLSFVLLLGCGVALIEAIVMLFVYELSRLLNSQQSAIRAAAIAVLFSSSLVFVGQMLVQRTLGSYFDALLPAGFLFWLGLPYLIFVGATTWMSWQQQVQRSVLFAKEL